MKISLDNSPADKDAKPVVVDADEFSLPVPPLELGGLCTADLREHLCPQVLSGHGFPLDVGSVDPAMYSGLTQRYIRYGVDEYVSSLLGGQVTITEARGRPRLVADAAILAVDIEDSTALFEKLEMMGDSPSRAIERILDPLARAVSSLGGRFSSIIGDGLSAVFIEKPAAWKALNVAMDLQEQWRMDASSGLASPSLRVGLSYGRVELSRFGTDARLRVIGSCVNRAFHAANGKSGAPMLPNVDPGFSIFLDASIREELELPNLITESA